MIQLTCITVSTRRVALQQAHQIIVLKDGQIVGKSALDELLENCEEIPQINSRSGLKIYDNTKYQKMWLVNC